MKIQKRLVRASFTGGMVVAALAAAPLRAEVVDYSVAASSKVRVFNFNGNRPFINPATGVPDLGTMLFNGTGLSYEIKNEGSNSLGNDPGLHIVHTTDPATSDPVTRVTLAKTDVPFSSGTYRTQMSSFPLEVRKHYVIDLEFKLDDSWDFGMNPGSGLIWQLKSVPNTGQYGNPVLALNLIGDELNFSICYPQSAANATVWPMASVTWGSNGYTLPGNYFENRKITKGEYHRLKLDFYADDAPNKPINDPVKNEGNGYLVATLDDQPWVNYVGPTLQPNPAAPHQMLWGWYQWSGMPATGRTDRIIYYRKAQVMEWK